jgi:hypothetical protein
MDTIWLEDRTNIWNQRNGEEWLAAMDFISGECGDCNKALRPQHIMHGGVPKLGQRRVRINVQGQMFESTAEILCREPNSLLAGLAKANPYVDKKETLIGETVTAKMREYKQIQAEISKLSAENPGAKTAAELKEEFGLLQHLQRKALKLAHSLEREEQTQSSDVYIDRDWWLFRYVLNFLRDGALPLHDEELMEKLYHEAEYWGLNSLQQAIEERGLRVFRRREGRIGREPGQMSKREFRAFRAQLCKRDGNLCSGEKLEMWKSQTKDQWWHSLPKWWLGMHPDNTAKQSCCDEYGDRLGRKCVTNEGYSKTDYTRERPSRHDWECGDDVCGQCDCPDDGGDACGGCSCCGAAAPTGPTQWDWWTGAKYNDIDFAAPGPDGKYDDFTGGVWGTSGRKTAEGDTAGATIKGRLPLTFCSANSALYNDKWNSRLGYQQADKVTHQYSSTATGCTMAADGDIGGMKWKGINRQSSLPNYPSRKGSAWFSGTH